MSKLDLETAKSIAREVLNALPGGMSIRTKSAKSGTSSPDDLSLQFVAYAHRTIADTVRAMKEGDIEKEGEPRFYVFSGKESGCAFISAEDTDNPVLGYTDSAENDFSDIPGGLLDLMESWRLAADVESTKVSKVSSATQRMATRGKGHMLFSPVVEPLLKTKWKQRSPYNYFCPKGYPAGCAAIAMAQVIRYYEWPKRGKGTHQYDDSSTPCWDFSYNQPDADSACPGLSIVKYGCGASDSVKIDFENTEYDYFNMPWKLDRNVDGMTSLRVEEKWSAALVRHCATAVNMDFWQAGSHPDLGKGGGAGNQTYLMGLEGLHDHFRYNNASEKHYYKTGWGKDVRNCLDEFRPVVFYSLNDMHFYICDGYGYADPKKSILYHFNFGWGGAWDGYYKEGEVKPNDSNYNLTQYVCTNLRPDAPYIILDVVFNLPDFKPLHYTANMESESIASPIFPYGKTPAVLDYDKVFRLEKSITYCGYQYVIDAIRINGIDNKIQPGSNRFTIKASQLERVGKVEVMMKPATTFSVGGIEYKPLSYKEVAVVNYSNVRPVINQTVTFNGM